MTPEEKLLISPELMAMPSELLLAIFLQLAAISLKEQRDLPVDQKSAEKQKERIVAQCHPLLYLNNFSFTCKTIRAIFHDPRFWRILYQEHLPVQTKSHQRNGYYRAQYGR